MSAPDLAWLGNPVLLDSKHLATAALVVLAFLLVGLMAYLIAQRVAGGRAHRQREAKEAQQVASFHEALLESQAPVAELARVSGLPRELLLLRRTLGTGG
jgi:hypothetical protein